MGGLIVDAVSDIVTISADSVQPVPTSVCNNVVPFLEGLAAIDDHMIMILDVAALAVEQIRAHAA